MERSARLLRRDGAAVMSAISVLKVQFDNDVQFPAESDHPAGFVFGEEDAGCFVCTEEALLVEKR